MNEPNENKAAPPVDVPRLVRQVVVERVTTKREEIPVTACLPHEVFEKAKSEGKVLTESETVEYIIKDYPEDHWSLQGQASPLLRMSVSMSKRRCSPSSRRIPIQFAP